MSKYQNPVGNPVRSQPIRHSFGMMIEHCLCATAQIRSHDLRYDLARRNPRAIEAFRCVDFRDVRHRCPQGLEHRVETWWDGTSRNWITQVKDWGNGQTGDATFGSNARAGALNHFLTVADTFLGPVPKVVSTRHTYALKHDELRSLIMVDILPEVIYQFLRAVDRPVDYAVWCNTIPGAESEPLDGDEWLAENLNLKQQ
jgi:hypothetical protein